MPCKVRYEPGSDVVLQVWTGSMSREVWSELAVEYTHSADLPHHPRVVVDISDAEWDGATTEADIEGLVARSMQYSEKLSGARIAIVTPEDWQKVLMVERVVERLRSPIMVIAFHRLAFACQWLDLDLARTAGELARMKWGPIVSD